MAILTSTSRSPWHRRSWRSTAAAGLLIAGSIAAIGLPAYAATPLEAGFLGPSFAGPSVTEPTAAKPESKLWYNDGFWWASMYSNDNPAGGALEAGYFIFKLDPTTNDWVRQDTQLDPRNSSYADVLWDGSKLYVASHIGNDGTQSTKTGAGNEKRLFVYNYNAATDTYTLASGYAGPSGEAQGKVIAPDSSETLVLAKEVSGGSKLWTTWVESPIITPADPSTTPPTPATYGPARVMVSWSTDGTTWTTYSLGSADAGGPNILSAMNLTTDDISSVVAFGNKIGVMWSNQETRKTYFAVHQNGQADSAWAATTVFEDTILPAGGKASDDHLNVKVYATANRLFAVTKTDFNQTEPDIILLSCNVTSANCATPGSWKSYTVYGGAETSVEHTRPILLIDTTPTKEKLHIFTAQPQSSSSGAQAIFRKTVAISDLSLPNANEILAAAPSVPFIQSSVYTEINNPTTTKQTVSDQTGMVVLASNDVGDSSKDVYVWNYSSLDSTPPPAPTSSVDSGTYPSAQTVTLTAEAGATIYYTTDGSDPLTSATRQTYTGPITISSSTTLKFYAADASGNASPVVTKTYAILPAAPTASPDEGTFNSAQTVTLTGEAGTTIYYTTDGSDPLTSATRQTYTGPLTISRTTTLKFYAANDAGASPVVTKTYTITLRNVYLPMVRK